jgi:RNA polymerase sigma-70 factor (ECF subfamily)
VRFCDFDAAYVERLVAGDAATARHFAAYFGELTRMMARRRLGAAPVDPEDVTQETLVRVLALLRSPRGIACPESLGGLVAGVCRNVIREMARAQLRGGVPAPDEEPAAAEESLDHRLDRERARDALRTAVGTLPTSARHLLESVFLAEDERQEVAQRIGVTRDYLRVLIQRALHRLRRAYGAVPGTRGLLIGPSRLSPHE